MRIATTLLYMISRRLGVLLMVGFVGSVTVSAALEARYVRIDNPTGFVMEFRQVEVYSGGTNVVLGHPEMVCGTVPPLRENTAPTQENIILSNPRQAQESGVVTREMEALRAPSANTYAMRYKGEIKIPQDWLYRAMNAEGLNK